MNVSKKIRSDFNSEFAWQRNYFEHIIRNQESLDIIKQYIDDNPQNWSEDKLFQE